LATLEIKWVATLDTLNPQTGLNLAQAGHGGDSRKGKRLREGWEEGVTRVCSSKTCAHAGVPQPVDNFFYKPTTLVDGRQSRCKKCQISAQKSCFDALDEDTRKVQRQRLNELQQIRRNQPDHIVKEVERSKKYNTAKRATEGGKEENRTRVAEWRAKQKAEDPEKYARWDKRNKLRSKEKNASLTEAEQIKLAELEKEFARVPKPPPVTPAAVPKLIKVVSRGEKATTNATQIRREWTKEFSEREPEKFERYKRMQSLHAAFKKRSLTQDETTEKDKLEVEFPKYWSYKISKRSAKPYMKATISTA
jgi:hypothetical protein